MFDPFLTGKAFGLVKSPSNVLVDLARSWSRQSDLEFESDGLVQWDGLTDLEVHPDRWRRVPSHISLLIHNALVHLGDLDGVAVIAFYLRCQSSRRVSEMPRRGISRNLILAPKL